MSTCTPTLADIRATVREARELVAHPDEQRREAYLTRKAALVEQLDTPTDWALVAANPGAAVLWDGRQQFRVHGVDENGGFSHLMTYRHDVSGNSATAVEFGRSLLVLESELS